MGDVASRRSGWVQLDTFDGMAWFQVALIACVMPPESMSSGAHLLIAAQRGWITVKHTVEETMDLIDRARLLT